jgi:hypothetical protein
MRFGPVATLVPGLVTIGAALLLSARTPEHASYVTDILPSMALLGLGAGLAFPALTMVAMSGATPSDTVLRPRTASKTQSSSRAGRAPATACSENA